MPIKKKVRRTRPVRKKTRAQARPPLAIPETPAVVSAPVPSRLPWILFGWASTAVFFLGVQHFNPIYHSGFWPVSQDQWRHLDVLLIVGILLLAWGMKGIPESGPADDIGQGPARILLFLILGLGAFLRLYGLSLYPANYWDDPAQTLYDSLQISDYHNFIRYGYTQSGEAGYSYLLAPILYFFPRFPGILAQRFLSTGLDLIMIWLFYLLGKEFGKRRIGLLMASFGAICRPLLLLLLSYMRYPALTACLALAMLFTVRLFKNPSAKHFFYWGLSLGLCYYTYTAIRVLGPCFLLGVLVWVLWRDRERASKAWDWALGLGLAGLMMFLFVYLHRFFFKPDNPLPHLLEWLVEKAGLQYLWGAALVGVGVKIWREARREGAKREILRWAWSALLFAALITPALLPIELRTRIKNLNALGIESNYNLFQVAGAFAHRISLTLNTLFYSGGDRSDMSCYGDPFFDVVSLFFILPGLVYAAVRPKPLNLFILGLALCGLVPHILADPGSDRLVDCIEPLLLLGALGVNRVMESAVAARRPWFWKTVVLGIWAGGVGFGADVNFQKIYLHFEKMPRQEVALAQLAGFDSSHNRVYLGWLAWFSRPENVMNEGKTIYRFSADSNTLYLTPEEPAPDIVALFRSDELPQAGIVEKLQAQFPHAQVSRGPILPFHPEDSTALVRVWIPGTDVTGDKTKLFHVERVPVVNWTRRFYEKLYRLGCGMIVGEDRVENLHDPFLPGVPAWALGECTGRLEGNWEAPTDGKYEFSVNTGQCMDFWIGDRLVLRARPGSTRTYKAKAYFGKGHYPVRIMVLNPISQGIPLLTVRAPGSDALQPL